MLEEMIQTEMAKTNLFVLEDLSNISGARVLVRVDYNVPFDDKGNIKEPLRIDDSLDTIRYLLERNAKVILISHNGRPEGKRNQAFSLQPVATYLSSKIGRKVGFVDDCIGDQVKEAVDDMQPGDMLLLQNLRFYDVESLKDLEKQVPDKAQREKMISEFVFQLASICDAYVNDSFGTAHNQDSSTVSLPIYLESIGKQVVAGRIMEHETKMLEKLIEPHGYAVAIMGGAKVKDKLKVIQQLVKKYHVCIGGAMANTFLKAEGHEIGSSLFEQDFIDTAKMLLGHYSIRIPVDVVVAKVTNPSNLANGRLRPGDYTGIRVVDIKKGFPVSAEEMILDIGPETVDIYGKDIRKADTIAWNGPMGYFEAKDFTKGTNAIAKRIAEAAHASTRIAGGGDSIEAIRGSGYASSIQLSTGGGAMIGYIEKQGRLPGILPLIKSVR